MWLFLYSFPCPGHTRAQIIDGLLGKAPALSILQAAGMWTEGHVSKGCKGLCLGLLCPSVFGMLASTGLPGNVPGVKDEMVKHRQNSLFLDPVTNFHTQTGAFRGTT